MPERDDGDDDDRRLWRRRAAGRRAPADACPGEGALAAFLDGRTPPDERERLEAHLALCPRCLAATLESARIDQVPPAPVSGELLARLTRAVAAAQGEPLPLPAWLAIAAALLLTLGSGFLLGARAMRDAAVLRSAAAGEFSLNPSPVVSAP
jgi:anti-sigma factor RsiW